MVIEAGKLNRGFICLTAVTLQCGRGFRELELFMHMRFKYMRKRHLLPLSLLLVTLLFAITSLLGESAMRKPTNFLTPYQQVEHSIREASNDEHGHDSPRRAPDLAGRAQPGNWEYHASENAPSDMGSTDDDLAPEILIHEDGARSPLEAGDDIPADRTYRVVRRDEAGGTFGLDEAELARIDPLDGKPWEPEDQLSAD